MRSLRPDWRRVPPSRSRRGGRARRTSRSSAPPVLRADGEGCGISTHHRASGDQGEGRGTVVLRGEGRTGRRRPLDRAGRRSGTHGFARIVLMQAALSDRSDHRNLVRDHHREAAERSWSIANLNRLCAGSAIRHPPSAIRHPPSAIALLGENITPRAAPVVSNDVFCIEWSETDQDCFVRSERMANSCDEKRRRSIAEMESTVRDFRAVGGRRCVSMRRREREWKTWTSIA